MISFSRPGQNTGEFSCRAKPFFLSLTVVRPPGNALTTLIFSIPRVGQPPSNTCPNEELFFSAPSALLLLNPAKTYFLMRSKRGSSVFFSGPALSPFTQMHLIEEEGRPWGASERHTRHTSTKRGGGIPLAPEIFIPLDPLDLHTLSAPNPLQQ